MQRLTVNLSFAFIRKVAVAAAVLTILILAGHKRALAETNTNNDEFLIKRQYMQNRVNDFYKRQDDLDKADLKRESASDEMRVERKKILTQHEDARKEFIKQKRAKPPEDPTAFEAELKARAAQREKVRQDFVKHRAELERESRNFDTIPPEEELGLSPEETQ